MRYCAVAGKPIFETHFLSFFFNQICGLAKKQFK